MLRWNRPVAQLLAAGYERCRSQSSVVIWDAQQADSARQQRPICELAQSEGCFSLDWLRQGSQCLAAGLSSKYIQVKVYDIREGARCQTSILTKSVWNLAASPFDEFQLLSHQEESLSVWDLRSSSRPLAGGPPTQQSKALLSIGCAATLVGASWDPLRRNVINVLAGNASPSFQQYRLLKSGPADTAWSHKPAQLFLPLTGPLAAVAFHRSNRNCVLAADRENHRLGLFQFCDETSLSCHSSDRLLASVDTNVAEVFLCDTSNQPSGEKDDLISEVMRRLAVSEYGTQTGEYAAKKALVRSVGSLHPEFGSIMGIWSWMELMAQFSWKSGDRFWGAMAVLADKNESNTIYDQRSSSCSSRKVGVYVSPARSRVMRCCGWPALLDDVPLRCGEKADKQELRIRQLAHENGRQGLFRATAIAVFCLRHSLAVELLSNAAERGVQSTKGLLRLAAISLAAYRSAGEDESQRALFLDLSKKAVGELGDVHLKAIFIYLSCRLENEQTPCFDELLAMEELALWDRVALACVHLSDQTLALYLGQLVRQLIEKGVLEGLLLTGLNVSADCLDLLQSYVDRTSDVQTAALLLIHGACISPPQTVSLTATGASSATPRSPNSRSSESPLVRLMEESISSSQAGVNMLEGYFSLLNSWRLYHCRSRLEALCSRLAGQRPSAQVLLSCTFCGKTLYGSAGPSRQRVQQQQQSQRAAPKGASCSACKKPLPRCSLCRRHMGTVQPAADVQRQQDETVVKSDRRFSSWFAWCQSCRHGGHVGHLAQWFAANAECPVTGCRCHCALADVNSPIVIAERLAETGNTAISGPDAAAKR